MTKCGHTGKITFKDLINTGFAGSFIGIFWDYKQLKAYELRADGQHQ
jgi:hypothetical protein